MLRNLDTIKECFQNWDTFILTTHASPDGDGVGSEIALYHFLRQQGKTVHILNPTPITKEFQFMDPENVIQKFEVDDHMDLVDNADAFIILDIGSYTRLKEFGEFIQSSSGKTVCIDHHPQTKHSFDYKIIEADAAATGMIIYELVKYIDSELMNFEIAQALYCAIMTDTGSFRFNNTTPHTHAIAKELLEYGVKPYHVYRNVYESYSLERMKLLGKIIDRLELTADRRIAYFPVTLDMQEEVGAEPHDVEGFSDFIRSIGDIEVAVMFHEMAPDQTRINFRSKGRVIINEVAKKFNGGGHKFAAGAIINKPYKDVIPMVIDEVKEVIDEYVDYYMHEEAEQPVT
jgi:phosphoesterase RecJ-like protein